MFFQLQKCLLSLNDFLFLPMWKSTLVRIYPLVLYLLQNQCSSFKFYLIEVWLFSNFRKEWMLAPHVFSETTFVFLFQENLNLFITYIYEINHFNSIHNKIFATIIGLYAQFFCKKPFLDKYEFHQLFFFNSFFRDSIFL